MNIKEIVDDFGQENQTNIQIKLSQYESVEGNVDHVGMETFITKTNEFNCVLNSLSSRTSITVCKMYCFFLY